MIAELVKKLIVLILLLYHSIVKFLIRKFTGLCELQRICYATDAGAARCLQVEKSIIKSKSDIIIKIHQRLSRLAEQDNEFNCSNKFQVTQLVEHAVEGICVAKSINVKCHEDFLTAMRVTLLQIYGYKQLCAEVQALKSTSYDANNAEHESHLLEIWKSLNPDQSLDERVSKQWTEIGFQSNDPKTDFRGMGVLGLMNLHYFVTHYASTAQSILMHSNHPRNGYPFAITGINLTHMAYVLLLDGSLKTHFFNFFNGTVCLNDFHKFYCYLFVHFDHLWLKEKPRDVMEFSFIRQKFLENIHCLLADERCKLIWQPSDVI